MQWNGDLDRINLRHSIQRRPRLHELALLHVDFGQDSRERRTDFRSANVDRCQLLLRQQPIKSFLHLLPLNRDQSEQIFSLDHRAFVATHFQLRKTELVLADRAILRESFHAVVIIFGCRKVAARRVEQSVIVLLLLSQRVQFRLSFGDSVISLRQSLVINLGVNREQHFALRLL